MGQICLLQFNTGQWQLADANNLRFIQGYKPQKDQFYGPPQNGSGKILSDGTVGNTH